MVAENPSNMAAEVTANDGTTVGIFIGKITINFDYISQTTDRVKAMKIVATEMTMATGQCRQGSSHQNTAEAVTVMTSRVASTEAGQCPNMVVVEGVAEDTVENATGARSTTTAPIEECAIFFVSM